MATIEPHKRNQKLENYFHFCVVSNVELVFAVHYVCSVSASKAPSFLSQSRSPRPPYPKRFARVSRTAIPPHLRTRPDYGYRCPLFSARPFWFWQQGDLSSNPRGSQPTGSDYPREVGSWLIRVGPRDPFVAGHYARFGRLADRRE